VTKFWNQYNSQETEVAISATPTHHHLNISILYDSIRGCNCQNTRVKW